MDWNNDALYDALPVTLEYAKVLARVVKRMNVLGQCAVSVPFLHVSFSASEMACLEHQATRKVCSTLNISTLTSAGVITIACSAFGVTVRGGARLPGEKGTEIAKAQGTSVNPFCPDRV
jgi:hypothetical protein